MLRKGAYDEKVAGHGEGADAGREMTVGLLLLAAMLTSRNGSLAVC